MAEEASWEREEKVIPGDRENDGDWVRGLVCMKG